MTINFTIGDDNWKDSIAPVIDGQRVTTGLVPRDYGVNPQGYYASIPAWSLDDMPLIPMEEWPERIRDLDGTQSSLVHIYDRGNKGQPIESLDQNGQGACWCYSTGCAIQMLRAVANMPYIQLSCHSVFCKIFNFVDRGAWGALSMEFAAKNGYVPTSRWPAKSMSHQYDTEANWDAAKEFRLLEGWVDLKPAAYDREMSAQQVGTALLSRTPVVSDYNWWGHSVCAAALWDAYPNRRATDITRYGTIIKNSWSDRWGDRGWGRLKDSKAFPNGGGAPRVAWGG